MDFIEKLLDYKGELLEYFLFPFLKKALNATNAEFGSLLLLNSEKRIISMVRAGDFSNKRICLKSMEKKLSYIFRTLKPCIVNNVVDNPYHLSFVKKKIKSELIYPFPLNDGKVIVLVLPSSNLGHFKYEHLDEIQNILRELSSIIENLKSTVRKNILLIKCHNIHENILDELLGDEFNLLSFHNPIFSEKIIPAVEFVFSSCNSYCSYRCAEAFKLSKILKSPVGIIRPFILKEEKNSSFTCSFYYLSSLSPEQERIIKKIKESKFYVFSKEWNWEKRAYLKIGQIQKYLTESKLENFQLSNILQTIPVSPSYLSRNFKNTVGINIKGFLRRLQMCKSLFLLATGKSIRYISKRTGYKFPSSFTKVFFKTFGLNPSIFLKDQ